MHRAMIEPCLHNLLTGNFSLFTMFFLLQSNRNSFIGAKLEALLLLSEWTMRLNVCNSIISNFKLCSIQLKSIGSVNQSWNWRCLILKALLTFLVVKERCIRLTDSAVVYDAESMKFGGKFFLCFFFSSQPISPSLFFFEIETQYGYIIIRCYVTPLISNCCLYSTLSLKLVGINRNVNT